MEAVCEEWINSGRPENMIRAARHYERASQIVISQQVKILSSPLRTLDYAHTTHFCFYLLGACYSSQSSS